MAGGTTFHFVTDGIEAALERALDAAGGKDVRIGGGAATIQQYLRAGLIDELHLAIVPVLLGAGERLFDDIGRDLPVGYECAEFASSANVAHARIAPRGRSRSIGCGGREVDVCRRRDREPWSNPIPRRAIVRGGLTNRAIGVTMQIEQPFTKLEILQCLNEVERDVATFFGALAPDEFVLRVGTAWTPAQHLQHLCTAVAAVSRGFAVPRLLLRLRFGRAHSPSRPYLELRKVYRGRLSSGARASGVFVPGREDLAEARIEERRTETLARWVRVNARLRTAVGRWSERELERIRLPHPILGLLTAREMLFFTVYHNQHHVTAAKGRLPRSQPTSSE